MATIRVTKIVLVLIRLYVDNTWTDKIFVVSDHFEFLLSQFSSMTQTKKKWPIYDTACQWETMAAWDSGLLPMTVSFNTFTEQCYTWLTFTHQLYFFQRQNEKKSTLVFLLLCTKSLPSGIKGFTLEFSALPSFYSRLWMAQNIISQFNHQQTLSNARS